MTWPHAFSFERRVPLRFLEPSKPAKRAPPPASDPGRVTAIIAEVAANHLMGPADVRAGSRRLVHARARQEAMHRLRQETKLSLPQIARALGLKDHTTVLHGLRAHAKRAGEGA